MSIQHLLFVVALTLGTPVSLLAQLEGQEPAHPDVQRVEPKEVLNEMSWLAGSWSGEMWGGTFNAYYSTPEGGKIISHSQLVKGEKVAFYEFEVFEARDLVVHLQPFPAGKGAVGFQLQSSDPEERKAIFENPDKDFPTRIVYHRVSDNGLEITLSDPHGGSDKVERFALKR
jgi:hypothetical protein